MLALGIIAFYTVYEIINKWLCVPEGIHLFRQSISMSVSIMVLEYLSSPKEKARTFPQYVEFERLSAGTRIRSITNKQR